MAFREVNDLSSDTTISLGGVNKKTGKPNPSKIEGYYLGKREVEDKKKKSGKSFIYILQTPKGNVGVWGKTDLDRKMNEAPIGTMIRATHVGMAQTPNGEMYKYKVEVDETNTIDIPETPAPRASSAQTYEADDGAAYGDDDTTEDDGFAPGGDYSDMTNEPTPVRKVASTADAEARKAKVQQMLNKNKKA
jgi:hypothetical protein